MIVLFLRLVRVYFFLTQCDYFFIDNFFYFNKINLPKISSFVYCFSELSNIEQGQLLCILLLLKTIFAAWGKWSIDVLFYSPSQSPPCVYVLLYLQVKNLKLKGKI